MLSTYLIESFSESPYNLLYIFSIPSLFLFLGSLIGFSREQDNDSDTRIYISLTFIVYCAALFIQGDLFSIPNTLWMVIGGYIGEQACMTVFLMYAWSECLQSVHHKDKVSISDVGLRDKMFKVYNIISFSGLILSRLIGSCLSFYLSPTLPNDILTLFSLLFLLVYFFYNMFLHLSDTDYTSSCHTSLGMTLSEGHDNDNFFSEGGARHGGLVMSTSLVS